MSTSVSSVVWRTAGLISSSTLVQREPAGEGDERCADQEQPQAERKLLHPVPVRGGWLVAVTEAAVGLDGFAFRRDLTQLGAHRLDVGIDVALVARVRGDTQRSEQLLPAVHAFRYRQQLLQQPEFQRGEF